MNKFRLFGVFSAALFNAVLLAGCGVGDPDIPNKAATSDDHALSTLSIFDWNDQPTPRVCEALRRRSGLTIGTAFTPGDDDSNDQALKVLENIIKTSFRDDIEILDREPRLSTLSVEILNCDSMAELRALSQVEFVDPEYALSTVPEDLFSFYISTGGEESEVYGGLNPAFYDPFSSEISYPEYLASDDTASNKGTVNMMKDHHVDAIYDEYQFFGSPEIGVAVLDNGVLPEYMDYLSAAGNFYTYNYYPDSDEDSINPSPSDLLYISQLTGLQNHGSTMAADIYKLAPRGGLHSLRATSFIYWYKPDQFTAVTNALLDAAKNPAIKVISASQGTVIHVHKIARAIDYLNAHDKIYVAAGGSSFPPLTEMIGIGFPANLPSTVSVTGIERLKDTNGEYVLGELAHGGPENDFTVEGMDASSPSVSHMSGVISLIWSANPSLTRQEVIDILKRSSQFYQENGEKDPKFGWGRVNAYEAFKEAISH